VRVHRILSGPLRGARIATSWHDYPAAIAGATERNLLRWFAHNVKAGETWLDVGAQYGYTAIALARLVGSSGRVFAFEPVPLTAGHLSATCRANGLEQVTVVPLALADPASLEVRKLDVFHGMADSTRTTGWHETLLAAKMDWLWPRLCGSRERIDGVKIDVQGMELEVLSGMAELLKAHRPRLVVEIHQDVSRQTFLEMLAQLGYQARGLPIDGGEDAAAPAYRDNHSYAFQPAGL
jgi:FkbM family methyltransferase